jgi:hypothetical protein
VAAATPDRTGGRVVNDLTSFLLARIAEDEQNWRRLARDDEFREVVLLGCVIQADRVLAKCEAKRRIVALHWDTDPSCARCANPDDEMTNEPWPCATLRLLALPYADHSDFQPEWRV